jgi:hypothetical protein
MGNIFSFFAANKFSVRDESAHVPTIDLVGVDLNCTIVDDVRW